MTDIQNQSVAETETSTGGEQSGRRFLVRIGGILRRNLATNLLILAGLGATLFGLGIAYRWATIQSHKHQLREVSLPVALAQLDAGAVEAARETAAELRVREAGDEQSEAGAAYVLGAVMARDAAQEFDPREQRALHLLAARYLEESQAAGFPEGRAGHGLYLLGVSLFEAGHFAASLPALLQALESYPSHRAEIHGRLATAYLRDANPQLERAHHHNAQFLATSKEPRRVVDRALLRQAEIEFQLGQLDECRQTLEQIEEHSEVYPSATLLRGRLWLRIADGVLGENPPAAEAAAEARRLYELSRDAFTLVRQQHSGNGDLVRQAQYLKGVALRRLGDYAAAEQQFSLTRRSNYDTEEGLAAGVQEAELLLLQGNHDAAITSFSRVFRQAADLPVYSNRWIRLDELRKRADAAYQAFYRSGDFPRAIRMAQALAPVFPSEDAIQLQAEAVHAWAQQRHAQAEQLPDTQADPVLSEAHAAYREAGTLYEQLARLRFATRTYPATLWKSARDYLEGQDYRRATRLLRMYLKNETRRLHPPALAALGEAQLALDQPYKALEALDECIEFFPKDPHTYRARLTAAKAYVEIGNIARAKQLLTDNLEHAKLTPRSPEWRESLYALGHIHYHEGLGEETDSRLNGAESEDPELHRQAMPYLERAHAAFQHAISLLSEAVQRDELAERDPWAPETVEARYLIAEAHRQSAKLPLHRLATVTIETTRTQLNSEIQRELAAAAQGYWDLQQRLNTKQETAALSGREQRVLRNSYFARADVLYDLENLEEAIIAYATATNRYQHDPEALEAYVQIANCHRMLNRPSEASGVLEQAKVVLQNIREDANFTSTTRYTRQEWETLLNWLTTL